MENLLIQKVNKFLNQPNAYGSGLCGWIGSSQFADCFSQLYPLLGIEYACQRQVQTPDEEGWLYNSLTVMEYYNEADCLVLLIKQRHEEFMGDNDPFEVIIF